MVQKKTSIVTKHILAMVGILTTMLLIGCGSVYADTPTPNPCVIGTESSCPVNSSTNCTIGTATVKCTDPAAGDTSCGKYQGPTTTDKTQGSTQCNFITQYVQPFVNFLTALVGVAVTISIVIGGIQYGSSAGDSAKVSAAKNRIRNSIIALLAFIFLYAMLNFLIPGGLV
jgi:hypothetical protein